MDPSLYAYHCPGGEFASTYAHASLWLCRLDRITALRNELVEFHSLARLAFRDLGWDGDQRDLRWSFLTWPDPRAELGEGSNVLRIAVAIDPADGRRVTHVASTERLVDLERELNR